MQSNRRERASAFCAALMVAVWVVCGPFSREAQSGEPSVARRGTRDVMLFELRNLSQVGHTGTFPTGTAGFACTTTSCNTGDVDLDWRATMDINHPFILQNLYRVHDGRIEQIGAAWIKHGFLSTNSSNCGTCQHPGSSALLGVGCSDTYGVSNNADYNWLGPRDELNPYTGFWNCVGSLFDGETADCIKEGNGYASGLDGTERRIEVKDADLNVSGAEYRYEGFYILSGGPEADVFNNIAWRPTSMSWSGSSWSTNDTDDSTPGPAINSWGTERATFSGGEGDVIVAVEASEISVGNFHFEYALYNHNLDRQVYSFSIAIDPGAVVSNEDFRDLDDVAGNDWSWSMAGGFLTFETDNFATDPNAPTLKYSTMYNFSFDVDRVPVDSSATIGLFKPGTGTSLTSGIRGPAVGPLDCNSNGVEDTVDVIGATSQDCNANGRPDECDIGVGFSGDCNMDGVPDECQTDCNANFIPDDCDISAGTSLDCQPNGTPDECEVALADCNVNGVPDDCDATGGSVADCQPNGVPDECEVNIPASFTVYSIAVEPDLSIPDDNGAVGVEHTFDITAHGIISDVDVDLEITHNWNSDLVVTLTHGNVTVTLIDRPGIPATQNGFDDDGFDVILDDDAATAIEEFNGGGALVTGTFSPNELLSAFNGLDKIGEWRLHLRDITDADPPSNGLLTDWSLHIDDAGQTGVADCDMNGVPDTCETDSDGDNVIDACDVECVCADFNTDGTVNLTDFSLLAGCFGTMMPTGTCPVALRICVDMTQDGVINLSDFSTFAFLFLQTPTGSPPNCLP